METASLQYEGVFIVRMSSGFYIAQLFLDCLRSRHVFDVHFIYETDLTFFAVGFGTCGSRVGVRLGALVLLVLKYVTVRDIPPA